MELYLNAVSNFSIQDDRGKKYTTEEARSAVDAGKMTDCNLSFQRLMQADYDIEKVKQFYAENP